MCHDVSVPYPEYVFCLTNFGGVVLPSRYSDGPFLTSGVVISSLSVYLKQNELDLVWTML